MSSILNLLDIWSTNSSCHLNYSDIYMSGNTNKGRIWEGQSAVGGREDNGDSGRNRPPHSRPQTSSRRGGRGTQERARSTNLIQPAKAPKQPQPKPSSQPSQPNHWRTNCPGRPDRAVLRMVYSLLAAGKKMSEKENLRSEREPLKTQQERLREAERLRVAPLRLPRRLPSARWLDGWWLFGFGSGC